MWERYAWFASAVFALCTVGAVASYLWDGNYLVWPFLFAVAASAAAIPLVVVRPLRAVIAALRPVDDGREQD